jgi:hypothetical protein
MTWEAFGRTELAFIGKRQVGGIIEIPDGFRCYVKRAGERIKSFDVDDRALGKSIVEHQLT